MPHTLTSFSVFFFNDTATTEIYTLSLHDALPISEAHAAVDVVAAVDRVGLEEAGDRRGGRDRDADRHVTELDRKSTRLNSSHSQISYAVFCLKKNKKMNIRRKTLTEVGTCQPTTP